MRKNKNKLDIKIIGAIGCLLFLIVMIIGGYFLKKEKNENTTVLETIIDNLIYAMYGLSEEEIQFISSQ